MTTTYAPNRRFARPEAPSAEYRHFMQTFTSPTAQELEAHMQHQDQQLLLIARTLDRTLAVAYDVNEELARQGEQLQRVEDKVDAASSAMDSGTDRIKSMLRRQKEHWRTALLGSSAASAVAGMAVVLIILL